MLHIQLFYLHNLFYSTQNYFCVDHDSKFCSSNALLLATGLLRAVSGCPIQLPDSSYMHKAPHSLTFEFLKFQEFYQFIEVKTKGGFLFGKLHRSEISALHCLDFNLQIQD